jgi:hypothetical protein
MGGWGPCKQDISGSWYIEMPKDAQFTIAFISVKGSGDGPCDNIKVGEYYALDIDLEYDITIGGVMTTKHSIGTIRLYGAPSP